MAAAISSLRGRGTCDSTGGEPGNGGRSSKERSSGVPVHPLVGRSKPRALVLVLGSGCVGVGTRSGEHNYFLARWRAGPLLQLKCRRKKERDAVMRELPREGGGGGEAERRPIRYFNVSPRENKPKSLRESLRPAPFYARSPRSVCTRSMGAMRIISTLPPLLRPSVRRPPLAPANREKRRNEG